MPDLRTTIAIDIRSHLRKFENAIDDSLVNGAKLTARMIEARREARLPLNTGQEALEQIVGTMSRLAEVRRMTIESHLDLSATRRAAGIDPVAFGDDSDTPDPSIRAAARGRHLRAVGA